MSHTLAEVVVVFAGTDVVPDSHETVCVSALGSSSWSMCESRLLCRNFRLSGCVSGDRSSALPCLRPTMSIIEASRAPCTPFSGSDTHSTTHVIPSTATREKEKTGAVYEQTEFLKNLLMHTNPNCFRNLKAVWRIHLGMYLTERQAGCWISAVLDLQPAIRGGPMEVAIHFL